MFGMNTGELLGVAAFLVLLIFTLWLKYSFFPKWRRRQIARRNAPTTTGRGSAAPAPAPASSPVPTPSSASIPAPARPQDVAFGLGAGLIVNSAWKEFTTPEEIAEYEEGSVIYWHDPENFQLQPEHWALALTAPYAYVHASTWNLLPGANGDWAREMLTRDWGIRTRTALLSQLHSLLTSGHRRNYNLERYGFMKFGDELAPEIDRPYVSSEQIAEETWQFYRMRGNDRNIMQVDFTAWDMFRFALLVRAGCAARHITVKEAQDFLLEPVPEMKACYSSWAEAGEHFRVGRWFWQGVGGEAERQADVWTMSRQQHLIQEPNPWADIPWDMEVPPSSGLLHSALISEGLLDDDDPLTIAPDPFTFWGHRYTEIFGQEHHQR